VRRLASPASFKGSQWDFKSQKKLKSCKHVRKGLRRYAGQLHIMVFSPTQPEPKQSKYFTTSSSLD